MKIITKSIDCKSSDLKGDIYEPMKIYFFSKYEMQQLLAIKYLLENPSKYFTEVYDKIISKDTYTYIYEGNKPSYHSTTDCNFLYSTMINYRIPDDIASKGEKNILRFRRWFKSVEHLLHENEMGRTKVDIFAMRLKARWNIETNIKAIISENSGVDKLENIDIKDLQLRINNNIKGAGRYYYESNKNTKILSKFSRISFIGNKKIIYGNDTGYSDDEVRIFLIDYNKRFKDPIKRDLIQYYKLKFNPDIKMEGKFLDQIGFKPCSQCH